MNTIDPLEHEARDLATAAPPAEPAARRRLVLPRRLRLIDQPGSAPGRAPRQPLHWGHVAIASALVALILGPLVLLAVHAGTIEWIPGGDRAVIELHVRDVGQKTPLVGPYSRYGWSHPGPLVYWVLAIPYRVLGSASSALLSATVVLNLVSVAGTLAIAWRRGRLPLLAMTALAISLLGRFLLATTLTDPWNPYVTVLPVLLFISLGWTVREGDRWAAPLALLVGSFLVQSHVGYIGLVALVLAWAAAGWVRERWLVSREAVGPGVRAPRVRRALLSVRPGPAIAVSVLVLSIVWAPVAIDQVRGTRNLSQLVSYFASNDEPTAGTSYAIGVVSRQVAGVPLGENTARPPWLGGDEPVDPIGGGEVPVSALWLGLAAAAFFVIAAMARRDARRATDQQQRLLARGALRFQVVVGLSVVAAVVSVARITDVVYNYLIIWVWVIAMLVWVSAAWSLWCVTAPRLRRLAGRLQRRWPSGVNTVAPKLRLLASTAIVLATAWSAQVFVGQVLASTPPEEYNRDPVQELSRATVAATPRGGPVLVESAGGGATNVADGVRLQLERADRPTVVSAEEAYKFGWARDANRVKPVTVAWVVSGEAIVDFAKRDDLRQVAIWDPLPSVQRARYFQDVDALRNQLLAAHRTDLFDALYSGDSLFEAKSVKGIDQALLQRVEDLRGKGRPVAVFVGPAPARA
ncbi:MAG: hypothetical protein HYX32_07800 [Actinobacteria bacterium]|nr:hypothetical protein [Actinomycetota bacterium]